MDNEREREIQRGERERERGSEREREREREREHLLHSDISSYLALILYNKPNCLEYSNCSSVLMCMYVFTIWHIYPVRYARQAATVPKT